MYASNTQHIPPGCWNGCSLWQGYLQDVLPGHYIYSIIAMRCMSLRDTLQVVTHPYKKATTFPQERFAQAAFNFFQGTNDGIASSATKDPSVLCQPYVKWPLVIIIYSTGTPILYRSTCCNTASSSFTSEALHSTIIQG